MFGSNVIDILLGLMVVFLAVSLAVSAGSEIASQWFSMRPDQLKKALVGMLEDGVPVATADADGHWFFGQTLLRSMADRGKKFPSYMDPKTFSEAILLAIDKDFADKKLGELGASLEQSLNNLPIDDGAKNIIRSYIRQSEGDIEKFRKLLESWFDRVMDRASGWYKRNIAIVSLIISALIVVFANIDALAIARALHGSDALRVKMLDVADRLTQQAPRASAQAGAPARPTAAGAAGTVQQAGADISAAEANPAALPDTGVEQSKAQLKILRTEFETMQLAGLPIGWQVAMPAQPSGWATKIIGWFITICAATLGAPFWFDMLSKIINIRNAGPKPKTKTDVVSPPAVPGQH